MNMIQTPEQKGAGLKSKVKAVAKPEDAKIVAILDAIPNASLARLHDILNTKPVVYRAALATRVHLAKGNSRACFTGSILGGPGIVTTDPKAVTCGACMRTAYFAANCQSPT